MAEYNFTKNWEGPINYFVKDLENRVPEKGFKVNVVIDQGKIVTEEDWSQEEQDEIAAAVIAQANEAMTLPYFKKLKINDIDNRTSELILTTPAEYNENQFSMSTNAQRNWIGMLSLRNASALSYPVYISTYDEGAYQIQDDNDFMQFVAVVFAYQTDPTKPLQSGRVLKVQVDACTTKAQVDSVVDNR